MIAQAYENPPRAYHNLEHIRHCLTLLDTTPESGNAALELAIWFHDAVYKPLARDNEARSADLMRRVANACGFPTDVLDDAHRIILVTAAHAKAVRTDERMMADIDLSVLAGNPEAYALYAACIRTEYAAVDDESFRTGRAAFLRSMLSSNAIFHTAWALEQGFEMRARVNLRAELDGYAGS